MIPEYPTLYCKDALGDMRYWRITVYPLDDLVQLTTEYGLVSGVNQVAHRSISEGFQGRNMLEQAILEANKAIKDKIAQSYTPNKSGEPDPTIAPLPMLAHLFEKHKHKLEYPVIVQPKLDGLRCIAVCEDSGVVSAWSRTGKLIESCGHITEELEHYMRPGQVFDGELYNHKIKFNKLSGAIRQKQEVANEVEYHIYDTILDESQAIRQHEVNEFFRMNQPSHFIYPVPSMFADNEQEICSIVGLALNAGFEGGIVRSQLNAYRSKYRSPHMLKVKNFKDDEFTIAGVVEGKGKDEGAAIFQCWAKNGEGFNVRPAMSYEERARIYETRESFIGKKLTVKYFELSEKGIPRFPVGIRIRGDE